MIKRTGLVWLGIILVIIFRIFNSIVNYENEIEVNQLLKFWGYPFKNAISLCYLMENKGVADVLLEVFVVCS